MDDAKEPPKNLAPKTPLNVVVPETEIPDLNLKVVSLVVPAVM